MQFELFEDGTSHKKVEKQKLSYEQFVIFWKSYPRKTGKFLAQKTFMKLDDDGDLFKKIMDSLEIEKQGRSWTKDNGIYVPYPATWLNQKRWQDNEAPKMSKDDLKKLNQRNAELERIKEKEWTRINSK